VPHQDVASDGATECNMAYQLAAGACPAFALGEFPLNSTRDVDQTVHQD
jgi:hypothetical protein